MDLDTYEKWLIEHDNKTSGSAYSYKIALPNIEKHYYEVKGIIINLFDLTIHELEKTVEDYGLKGKYSEIGAKSNGTYRNALNALLRFKKENPNKDDTIKSKIRIVLFNPHIKELINESSYHFQNLLNIKDQFLKYPISVKEIEILIDDYNNTKDISFEDYVLTKKDKQKEFLEIVGEYISYMDSKSSGKKRWNKYSDYRTIAQAGVRQNHWVNSLLQLKINPDFELPNSIRNAIDYSISPMKNINVLSENHREFIAKNILNKPYVSDEFINDLINFFEDFKILPKNYMNYTHIISSVLYNIAIKSFWLIKNENTLEMEKLDFFEKYRAFLIEFKRNSLAENTIESYYTQASTYGKKWIAKNGIDILKIEEFNNSELIKLSNALEINNSGFSGIYSFKLFINYLLDHKNHFPLNQILYGPPGTGKTYSTKELAVNIVLGKKVRTRDEILESFDELQKNKQITFTTFHQSISYEDFVEGIKPETVNENVTYEVKDGIFKQICGLANVKKESNFEEAFLELLKEFNDTDNDYIVLKTPTNKEYRINLNSNNNLNIYTSKEVNKQGVMTKSNLLKKINGEDVFRGWEGYANGVIDYLKTKHSLSINKKDVSKNYVLIIDEINRGNISSIFGELITLLEEDKRKGNKEEIEVILPYSNERFSVPSNLYIIGTMNTADRSVEALDTALRRRFSFTEIQASSETLRKARKSEFLNYDNQSINLEDMLEIINKRIELLVDKDHKIGHSYFINIESFDELKSVFENKVIPLLKEYFFGDYGKIGLILGDGFIKLVETKNKVEFAKNFNYEDKESLREKSIYKFTKSDNWTPKTFISIYSNSEKISE